MTKLDLQYDLANGTPASASPPQANFVRTEQYVNQELINRDGSVAMSAQLKLVGDPLVALDAAPKQYVDSYMPIGSIVMFAGGAAPAGGRWLLCNGADVQQSVYPDLFTVIGTNYTPAGAAPGHFSLPNMSGKFPIGSGTDTLGSSGGSRDAIVAAHTHTVDHTHGSANTGTVSADHSHGVNINTGGFSENHFHYEQLGTYIRYNTGAPQFHLAVTGGGGFDIGGELIDSAGLTTNWAAQNHYHNVAGNTGGISANHSHAFQPPTFNGNAGPATGAAATTTNANLPPYVTVNYIIRVN